MPMCRSTLALILALFSLASTLGGCANNEIIRNSYQSPAEGCTPSYTKTPDEQGPQGEVHDRCAHLWREVSNSPQVHAGSLATDDATRIRDAVSTERPSMPYELLFVEFDDEGRLYGTGDDTQLEHTMARLKELAKAKDDLSILVFVHGWRHNASQNDRNVMTARFMLESAALFEEQPPHPNPTDRARKVVGIFVGWRGQSLTAPVPYLGAALEFLSFWDRKHTAERVATGQVRQLFERLKRFQELQNAKARADAPGISPALAKNKCHYSENDDNQSIEDLTCDIYKGPPVRLLIVGHSFGGLLIYNAIAQSLISSITQDQDNDPPPDGIYPTSCPEINNDGSPTGLINSYGDLVILINPAIEGTFYEPLHQALLSRWHRHRFCENQRPVLISLTSESDYATKTFFPIGRWINDLTYDKSPAGGEDVIVREEHEASLNTYGHIRRFHTHRLEYLPNANASNKSSERIISEYNRLCSQVPPPTAEHSEKIKFDAVCKARSYVDALEPSKCATLVEELLAAKYLARTEDMTVSATASERLFAGGAWLVPLPEYGAPPGANFEKEKIFAAAHSPIWNIYVTDNALIKYHSGIGQLPLLKFFQQVYHDSAIASPELLKNRAQRLTARLCSPPL